ncbi:hypothetical protein CTA2_10754 [Colletotrichum tanaceti]|nr:hypothetical protein CTA2_10754 [Colletotrichum tanaceti]
MAATQPHHHLKPLISLRNLLERDAAIDDALIENLKGGGSGRTGTGLLLNESQPYDPTSSESTQSRHRVALRNLQKIRNNFEEPVYYLCLFASSVTALSKDPFKTGFWTALEQWPDRGKIPSDFTIRARKVVEAYYKKMREKDGGATSQQKTSHKKRRRETPDTSEQLRLTNTSKRLRVRPSSPTESEASDVVDHDQRLSVSPNSSPVTRKANRRLQRPEDLMTPRRDALSHTSSRRISASPSPEVQSIPRVVAYRGNKEDGNNRDDIGGEDGHNHDQEDGDDNNHKVDEFHLNDGYSNNQSDGAAKDPSLLISHDTLLQDVRQLRMPHLHGSQPDVSHTSLQAPLQFQSQAQLEASQDQLQMPQHQLVVSHENHFLLQPGTTEYAHPQVDTLYLPKFRGYLVPKAYLYEELAHYPEMVKLLFPLTPESSPFFTVDVSENQARKYWAGRKRFM